MAEVRSGVERQLADVMLSMGSIRQNSLASGALLSSRPIADTEVHSLLDGLLVIEYDGNPVVEAGPGAIFDPSLRTPESNSTSPSEQERRVGLACCRATGWTATLLGVAAQQTARLRDPSAPDVGVFDHRLRIRRRAACRYAQLSIYLTLYRLVCPSSMSGNPERGSL